MSSLLGVLLVIKTNVDPAKLLFWARSDVDAECDNSDVDKLTPEADAGEVSEANGFDRQSRYAIHHESKGEESQRSSESGSKQGLNQLIGELHLTAGFERDGVESNGSFDYEGVIADALIPDARLCNQLFELKIGNYVFVGHPSVVDKQPNEGTSYVFNVAIVLRHGASRSALNHYHQLAQRIATALKYEELRSGYLSTQTKIMVTQHDEAQKILKAEMPQPLQSRSCNILHRILQYSSLAQDLTSIVKELLKHGVMHVRLGSWISASFKVHPDERSNLKRCSVGNASMNHIRPYLTLLLHGPSCRLLDRLPADCSPSLYRLVQYCSPFKTLQEMALEFDITLPQIYRLANHLVSWGEASLTHTICGHNIYCIATNFNVTETNQNIACEFSQTFPQSTFWGIITKFSLPRPFSDHMKPFEHSSAAAREQHLLQIQWLLQRGALRQLHTYIYLCVAPPSSAQEATSSEPESLPSSSPATASGSESREQNPSDAPAVTATLSTSVTSRIGFVPGAPARSQKRHSSSDESHTVNETMITQQMGGLEFDFAWFDRPRVASPDTSNASLPVPTPRKPFHPPRNSLSGSSAGDGLLTDRTEGTPNSQDAFSESVPVDNIDTQVAVVTNPEEQFDPVQITHARDKIDKVVDISSLTTSKCVITVESAGDNHAATAGMQASTVTEMQASASASALPTTADIHDVVLDHNGFVSARERDVIMAHPSSQDDRDLVLRLSPYFRGEHVVEEILYKENMKREQLIELVKRFAPILRLVII